MKKTLLIISAISVIALSSCKKEYVCVCTIKSTGEKSYGDRIKSGPFLKKTYEESCKANDDVFEADLENCHLE